MRVRWLFVFALLSLVGCATEALPPDAGLDAFAPASDAQIDRADGALRDGEARADAATDAGTHATADAANRADSGGACVRGLYRCAPSGEARRCEGDGIYYGCIVLPAQECSYLAYESCAAGTICRLGASGEPQCAAPDAPACVGTGERGYCEGTTAYRSTCIDGLAHVEMTSWCDDMPGSRCEVGASGRARCVALTAVPCVEATFPDTCGADGAILRCADGFTWESSRCSDGTLCLMEDGRAACVDAIFGVPVSCTPGSVLPCPAPTSVAVCTSGGHQQTRPCADPTRPETATWVCTEAGVFGHLCLPPDTVFCDPSTYVDTCEGATARYCSSPSGPNQVVTTACPDTCRISTSGAAVCTTPDALPCLEDDAGHCVFVDNRIERCSQSPNRHRSITGGPPTGFASIQQCTSSERCIEGCSAGACTSPGERRLFAECMHL